MVWTADVSATSSSLLQKNPGWFILLVPAYPVPGCPGKTVVKWVLLLLLLLLQLLCVHYPVEMALSADETVLRAAEFYIRFVARGVATASSTDDADNSPGAENQDVIIDDMDYTDRWGAIARYLIRLHKLLAFPTLRNCCQDDVSVLR